MNPEKLKAKRDADIKLLHDYIAKNPGARAKKLAGDLGWTKSKFDTVYARCKPLFYFGLVCKSRPNDAMATFHWLEARV